MATYIELKQQIESLQREADELRAKERKGVIARMKEAIDAYGISAADLGFGSAAATKRTRRGRPPRAGKPAKGPRGATGSATYSDSQGNTWGGRGKRPNWLREALANGAKLEDFAVKK